MNKPTGYMYSYIDRTYNPIKGDCIHQCSYCYMTNMRRRFHLDPTLRLDEKTLKQGLGSGRLYFVVSSTDEWASNVPTEWITRVLDHLAEYPENVYQLQTKNPARFLDFLNHPLFDDRERVIFCTTIESDINHLADCKAPSMQERVEAMQALNERGFKTMVTVEPIMAFTSPKNFADFIASVNPIQVNFGFNTSRDVILPEPTNIDFMALVLELDNRNINVHFKKNIR